MSHEPPKRQDLPTDMTWDLTTIFPSDEAWEAGLKELKGAEDPIMKCQGNLDDPEQLASCFRQRDELYRKLEKLYTYAHLRSDEDTGNSITSGMQDRVRGRYMQVAAELAWIEPELLALPEQTLQTLYDDDQLKPYRRLLDVLLRDKPHTLSAAEERLLAMASEPLGAAQKAFSKLNNADLTFPKATFENGQEMRVTHGNYIGFLESKQREVRKAGFEAIFDTYGTVRNTLAATLDGHVRKQVFLARARRFDSALEASLHRDQVPVELYRSLIEAIHQGLPTFYKYMEVRRRALGLETLDMYDQHVSIVPEVDLKVPYEEACEWALQAVKPLGDEYVKVMRKGLTERWIDVLECKGKRSGAYSSGCYDTNPFILLNHQNNLNSAFTLVHELGHSLHSYFSNATQPHLYGDYSIMVAEVASITNEALLADHLMKEISDPRIRAYLLNYQCDGFRTTMYRQTMFAEFEWRTHQLVEADEALTTDALCELYYELNQRYYGDAVQPDQRIELEWARIPHFYYNFYVYKYATGFAAAQVFAERLLSGDSQAVDAYLGFLKAGSSKDPLDILSDAGVDLRDPAVIASAIERFDQLIDQLDQELAAL